MEIYNISGIILEFTPLFPDYFESRLAHFICYDEEPNRIFKTHIGDIEPLPDETPYFSHLSKVMFRHKDMLTLYIYSDASRSKLMQKITYDQDFRSVDILLSPDYQEKLPEIEYLTTGLFFFEMAIREGKYPIHGSAISYQNEAIIFSAPSGVGKSTHAGLWMQYLNDVLMINDDKPLLFFKDNQLFASGTPWSGKTDLTRNILVPVKAIVFLSQSTIPHIIPITQQQKVVSLLKNGFRSREETTQNVIFSFINKIIESKIDIFNFETDISKQAFDLIYHYLYGGDQS